MKGGWVGIKKSALLHELCSATTLFPLPLFPAFGAGGNIKEDLFMLSASADEQVLPASGELPQGEGAYVPACRK